MFLQLFFIQVLLLPVFAAQNSHKKTLYDTCAHFRGRKLQGQADLRRKTAEFLNEVKDLAHFEEKQRKEKHK
ncbi:hypothetical protein V8J88_16905 [Massilia sp. W12]|uniref:hypothetical protein n=1 Tax=Massilia sp. W12 TaxID=3126507 RepID=UPI0030D52A3B